MRFLGIQNCEVEGFGLYQRRLAELGIDLDMRPAYRGDALPDATAYDGILIGGTPAAAYELERHSFLAAEAHYLEQAVGAHTPCLGICFGAQLLAAILGGGVRRAAEAEIGITEIEVTPAGLHSQLLAGFPMRFPVFQWHGDTFGVPPGGELLAAGKVCRNQAFHHGTAVGVQFHLEITADEARRWAVAYSEELRLHDKTTDQVVDELQDRGLQLTALAELLTDNFVQIVRTSRSDAGEVG